MEQGPPRDTDFWQTDVADLAEMVLRKDQFSMRPPAMRVLADRIKTGFGPISLLADALHDLDPSTRRRAAQTLGFCGEAARSLLPELCRLLRSDCIWTVREAAAHAIHSLCWPAVSLDSSNDIPLRLVECVLFDRELLVRQACIQTLDYCLEDAHVAEAVKVAIRRALERGMQHAQASHRCRAVGALVALAGQNPALIGRIAEGLQDSHWKVRRTTVQQLASRPELVFSVEGRRHLLAEVVKRRFDQHHIVQATARQAFDRLQEAAPQDIQPILKQIGSCETAAEAMIHLGYSERLSATGRAAFLQLVQRRIDWHLREMPSPKPVLMDQTTEWEGILSCVFDLAGQWMASPKRLARDPEGARAQVREKEASWLLARLMEILLT